MSHRAESFYSYGGDEEGEMMMTPIGSESPKKKKFKSIRYRGSFQSNVKSNQELHKMAQVFLVLWLVLKTCASQPFIVNSSL